MKIRLSTLNFKNSVNKKFKILSNFQPVTGTYPPEIDQLHILLKQELRKLPERTRVKDNLNFQDKVAIRELKNNTDLVIKPADKGSAIVIMDREDYIFEAEKN